jgi:hypothetical protein
MALAEASDQESSLGEIFANWPMGLFFESGSFSHS